MTDPEALDSAVARTGHARFRELLDPAHPDHNPAYWPVVRELAGTPPVPGPPGVFRKAASLARAVAGHVAAGLPVLGEEATAARLAVCEACEHKRGDSCGLCGCGLKLKASWKDSHCPIRKWPGEALLKNCPLIGS